MRKDQLKAAAAAAAAAASSANDDEATSNGESGGDAFDALLSAKPSEGSSSVKTNGKSKIPSPVPDDSDTEKDDETEAEPEANTSALDDSTVSETNGTTAKSGDENDDDVAKDESWEVEQIVGQRMRDGQKFYRIRWKDFGEKDDTWEPEEDLSCPELIEKYLAEHPKKEKKVRISLPATREAPKRTAAERKSFLESDQDSNDSSNGGAKKRKSIGTPKKENRGRPPKGAKSPKKTPKKSASVEYEVLKVVDDEMRGGKKFYRIRWKGFSAKDDTWEPKSSLHCPDKIKEYEESQNSNEEYDVEKIVGEKIEKGVRYFLVKWKNWSEDDNTWEREDNVECLDLIEKFRDSCRSAPNKSKKRPAAATPAAKTPSPTKAKKAKKPQKEEAELITDDLDPLGGNDDDDDDDDEEEDWEVQKIMDERKKGRKTEYLIRWKGCDASQDSWEPEDNINCPALVAAFTKKNKK